MQNSAQIDILKKVTRQTVKYFIDPYVICSAYIEIHRYVTLVLYGPEIRNVSHYCDFLQYHMAM